MKLFYFILLLTLSSGLVSTASVDYCASGPCVNGGSCRNAWWLGGGYICYCPEGYTGLNCQICINPCEFDQIGYAVCQNGANCKSNSSMCGKYVCECAGGFVGEHCQNRLNPCASSPCQNDAKCNVVSEGTVDSPGRFFCICKPGVIGKLCDVFVDPCKYRKCDNGGVCVASSNNTYLETKTRFSQTTKFIMGQSSCTCDPNYATGPNCEFTIDPCARNPCLNNATCRALSNATFYSSGQFECDCPSGTLGPRCDHYTDPCRYQPCVNDGVCRTISNNTYYPTNGGPGGLFIQTLGQYECQCPVGFSTGKNCQYLYDPCIEKPCQNGGDCVKMTNGKLISRSFPFFALTYWLGGDFKCECINGYKGVKCQFSPGQEPSSFRLWEDHEKFLPPLLPPPPPSLMMHQDSFGFNHF